LKRLDSLTATTAVRVPWIQGGRDHLPLTHALASGDHKWVYFHAKPQLTALALSGVAARAPLGDGHLAAWLLKPSGKTRAFAELVAEVLGIELPAPRTDQLLPEDNAVGVGGEAWCALAIWTQLAATLDSGVTIDPRNDGAPPSLRALGHGAARNW